MRILLYDFDVYSRPKFHLYIQTLPFEIFYDIKYSIFIHQRKYCRYEDIDGFFPSTKFLERKSPEISFDHLIFFNTRSISGFVALNI